MMKDLFITFLQTQNVATIMAEVTAMLVVWQGYLKYRDGKKKAFEHALKGTEKIDDLLLELKDQFGERMIIPTVAEVTNGGGVPKYDRPLYVRAINSTNEEVLNLWGDKTLVVSALNKALLQLVSFGNSSLAIEKFNLRKVERWAGAKSIEKVFYFVIGYKRKGMYLLSINSETSDDLTDEEYTICEDYAARFRQAFNGGKNFWESEMTV